MSLEFKQTYTSVLFVLLWPKYVFKSRDDYVRKIHSVTAGQMNAILYDVFVSLQFLPGHLWEGGPLHNNLFYNAKAR